MALARINKYDGGGEPQLNAQGEEPSVTNQSLSTPERQTYHYGDSDIDLKCFIRNLQDNKVEYLNSKRGWSAERKQAFLNTYQQYMEALNDMHLSADYAGNLYDNTGKLQSGETQYKLADGRIVNYDEMQQIKKVRERRFTDMFDPNGDVAHYFDLIANAQRKYENKEADDYEKKRQDEEEAERKKLEFNLDNWGLQASFYGDVNPYSLPGDNAFKDYMEQESALDKPQNKKNKYSIQKRAARMLDYITNIYLNDIKNCDFSKSRYKSYDNYKDEYIDPVIKELENILKKDDAGTVVDEEKDPDFAVFTRAGFASQFIHNYFARNADDIKITDDAGNPIGGGSRGGEGEVTEGGYTDEEIAWLRDFLEGEESNYTVPANYSTLEQKIDTKIKYPGKGRNGLDLTYSRQNSIWQYVNNINDGFKKLNDVLNGMGTGVPTWRKLLQKLDGEESSKWFGGSNSGSEGSIYIPGLIKVLYDMEVGVNGGEEPSTTFQKINTGTYKDWYVVTPTINFENGFGIIYDPANQMYKYISLYNDIDELKYFFQTHLLDEYRTLNRSRRSLLEKMGGRVVRYAQEGDNSGDWYDMAMAQIEAAERQSNQANQDRSQDYHERAVNRQASDYNVNDAGWTSADYARMGALAADLAAVVCPSGLASGLLSLGSTVTMMAADKAEGATWGEAIKNSLPNLGFAALSFIPVVGGAIAGGAKITKVLTSWLPKIMLSIGGLLSAGYLYGNFDDIVSSFKKLKKDGPENRLTVKDFQNFYQVISALLLAKGARNMYKTTQAAKKLETTGGGEYKFEADTEVFINGERKRVRDISDGDLRARLLHEGAVRHEDGFSVEGTNEYGQKESFIFFDKDLKSQLSAKNITQEAANEFIGKKYPWLRGKNGGETIDFDFNIREYKVNTGETKWKGFIKEKKDESAIKFDGVRGKVRELTGIRKLNQMKDELIKSWNRSVDRQVFVDPETHLANVKDRIANENLNKPGGKIRVEEGDNGRFKLKEGKAEVEISAEEALEFLDSKDQVYGAKGIEETEAYQRLQEVKNEQSIKKLPDAITREDYGGDKKYYIKDRQTGKEVEVSEDEFIKYRIKKQTGDVNETEAYKKLQDEIKKSTSDEVEGSKTNNESDMSTNESNRELEEINEGRPAENETETTQPTETRDSETQINDQTNETTTKGGADEQNFELPKKFENTKDNITVKYNPKKGSYTQKIQLKVDGKQYTLNVKNNEVKKYLETLEMLQNSDQKDSWKRVCVQLLVLTNRKKLKLNEVFQEDSIVLSRLMETPYEQNLVVNNIGGLIPALKNDYPEIGVELEGLILDNIKKEGGSLRRGGTVDERVSRLLRRGGYVPFYQKAPGSLEASFNDPETVKFNLIKGRVNQPSSTISYGTNYTYNSELGEKGQWGVNDKGEANKVAISGIQQKDSSSRRRTDLMNDSETLTTNTEWSWDDHSANQQHFIDLYTDEKWLTDFKDWLSSYLKLNHNKTLEDALAEWNTNIDKLYKYYQFLGSKESFLTGDDEHQVKDEDNEWWTNYDGIRTQEAYKLLTEMFPSVNGGTYSWDEGKIGQSDELNDIIGSAMLTRIFNPGKVAQWTSGKADLVGLNQNSILFRTNTGHVGIENIERGRTQRRAGDNFNANAKNALLNRLGLESDYNKTGFSADALDLTRLANTIRTNNRVADVNLPVMLYSPLEGQKRVFGDEAAKQRGRQAAGNYMHLVNNNLTSDATTNYATMMNAWKKGNEDILKGFDADNARMASTREEVAKQEQANKAERHNVAEKNMANLVDKRVEDINREKARIAANHQAVDEYLKMKESDAREADADRKKMEEAFLRTNAKNNVYANLDTYFPGWSEQDKNMVEAIYNGIITTADLRDPNSNVWENAPTYGSQGDALSRYNQCIKQINNKILELMAEYYGISYNPAPSMINDSEGTPGSIVGNSGSRQSSTSVTDTSDIDSSDAQTITTRHGGVIFGNGGSTSSIEMQELRNKAKRMELMVKQLGMKMTDFQKSLDRAQKGAESYIKRQTGKK